MSKKVLVYLLGRAFCQKGDDACSGLAQETCTGTDGCAWWDEPGKTLCYSEGAEKEKTGHPRKRINVCK